MKKEVESNKAAHYRRTYSYWESRAPRYLEESKQKILNKVLSILRKMTAVKILDIGSGPAHYAIKIANVLGCQVTCLDFSQEMLVRARENTEKAALGEQFSFVMDNIAHAELPAGSFDAVTIISVLHYLIPNDIEIALQKSYATLKSGGKIIVVEYWANKALTETEEFALRAAERNRAKQGVRTTFLKEDEYKRLLKRAGFKSVKVCYVRERIYLEKYFKMDSAQQPTHGDESSIRVAIFEATK